MRTLRLFAVVFAALALSFGLGALFLYFGTRILGDGQLTYARRKSISVTVSPESDAFSYYYQVAFHFSGAAFFLLIGVAICMFGFAKLARKFQPEQGLLASRLYCAANFVAWSGIGSFCLWFLLKALRSSLIA